MAGGVQKPCEVHGGTQVIAHLKAETAHTKAALADTEKLQESLYKELRGRIQEVCIAPPPPPPPSLPLPPSQQSRAFAVAEPRLRVRPCTTASLFKHAHRCPVALHMPRAECVNTLLRTLPKNGRRQARVPHLAPCQGVIWSFLLHRDFPGSCVSM